MRRALVPATVLATAVLTSCSIQGGPQSVSPRSGAADDIHRIKHVVLIMQENRSFDSYFGTYPGADGAPRRNGQFSVCVPDPAAGSCVVPFHDDRDVNGDGPHSDAAAIADINGGRMNGFIAQAEAAQRACADPTDPSCAHGQPGVMGYHDAREIPNYWAYAHDFVLQDHMFEPNASWSLPEHLFMVSEWSARCQDHDPSSCVNALESPIAPPNPWPGVPAHAAPIYAWTDLTYLLHRAGVSWRYYVQSGTEPDCESGTACTPPAQRAATPGIWNPLPYFDTVKNDGELQNISDVTNFVSAAAKGTLPAVSWIVPSIENSEHAPATVSAGQAWVTSLVNAIMQGPNWDSTAIFVSWDDWGGFYDHVPPPVVDENGYGLRVPGLVISAYARKGFIDHQPLSFDAYVKFIEDDFLGGRRIDPLTDGRPDPRPDVRENARVLGDLRRDFDFSQALRPALVLPTYPPAGPASIP